MADVPVGSAGGCGKFATFLLYAHNPALPLNGALESLSGQQGLSREKMRLGGLGIDVSLAVGGMGYYILNAASFE